MIVVVFKGKKGWQHFGTTEFSSTLLLNQRYSFWISSLIQISINVYCHCTLDYNIFGVYRIILHCSFYITYFIKTIGIEGIINIINWKTCSCSCSHSYSIIFLQQPRWIWRVQGLLELYCDTPILDGSSHLIHCWNYCGINHWVRRWCINECICRGICQRVCGDIQRTICWSIYWYVGWASYKFGSRRDTGWREGPSNRKLVRWNVGIPIVAPIWPPICASVGALVGAFVGVIVGYAAVRVAVRFTDGVLVGAFDSVLVDDILGTIYAYSRWSIKVQTYPLETATLLKD